MVMTRHPFSMADTVTRPLAVIGRDRPVSGGSVGSSRGGGAVRVVGSAGVEFAEGPTPPAGDVCDDEAASPDPVPEAPPGCGLPHPARRRAPRRTGTAAYEEDLIPVR